MQPSIEAIVLFSHGALICGARQTLDWHACGLAERGVAGVVRPGYLNYSEPLFAELVAELVAAGVTRLIVTPYFLVPGRFVTQDLPREIAAVHRRFPSLELVVADPIGFDPALADAILSCAAMARGRAHWGGEARAAAVQCAARADCPLFGGPLCQATGAPGEAALPAADGYAPGAPELSATSRGPGDAVTDTALVVMAHGSRRQAANDDLFRVVEVLRGRGVYNSVRAAFLECSDPLIPDALDACASEGAARIVAVPYFLHPGGHTALDLPELMEQAAERHGGVEILLAPYIGRSRVVTDILAARTREAMVAG